MNEEPLVSIIVPTYNSERTLERCLKSIKNQTYKNIELIIVDGISQDKTVEIAKEYGADVHLLTRRGRSRQTNYGMINVSNGKYVYRVDHDVILEPKLVEEAVKKCETEGYDALSIFYSPDPTISFWSKVRKLEKDCYKEDLLHTGPRFFRKDVFESIGGFKENIVFDECYELNNRIRKTDFKIGIIESQELHIGEPETLGDVFRKQYYYGLTIRDFLHVTSTNTTISQLHPFRWVLIKNWKKFAKNPDLTVGFIVYDVVQYSAALSGLMVSYIRNKGSEEQ